MKLGIDFGTCYSSAALIHDGSLKAIKEPLKHGFSFPSSVFVTKQGDVVVGQAAENQRRADPTRYRHEFKRDLGGTIPFALGDRSFLPEDLISQVIACLKAEAQKIVNEPLTEAVITVPANYQDYKKQLMVQAAKQAGFEDVTILVEPVAAAMYYAQTGSGARSLQEGDILLVYDLGGGTFDAALIQKQGSGFELLAQPVGDENCGGIDFDRQIYADFKENCSDSLRELLDSQQPDVMVQRSRLMVADWCRDFKHQLSVVSEHEDVFGMTEEAYKLSQAAFERMTEPFVSKTHELCQQLINSAGVTWEQVSQVLMVGGSSRVPYVRRSLEQRFQRPVIQVDEPELAVCLGAATYMQEQRGDTVESSQPKTLTVSASGEGDYTSIWEALENSESGTQILVKPGIYQEGGFDLGTDIEIIGDGLVDQIVIEDLKDLDVPCILRISGDAVIRGLTLRSSLEARPNRLTGIDATVEILDGSPLIENCNIIPVKSGAGIYIGDQGSPTIRRCHIHDGVSAYGVVFIDNNQRTIMEHCEIYRNGMDNIQVCRGAKPVICNCKIYDTDGEGCGLGVFENSAPTVENCDIFGNFIEVMVSGKANPIFRQCKIHDGRGANIVCAGQGMFEDCDIFGTQEGFFNISVQGGNPIIRRCQIHDGWLGVSVFDGGQGFFEDCHIYNNINGAWEIEEGCEVTRVRNVEQESHAQSTSKLHPNDDQREVDDYMLKVLQRVKLRLLEHEVYENVQHDNLTAYVLKGRVAGGVGQLTLIFVFGICESINDIDSLKHFISWSFDLAQANNLMKRSALIGAVCVPVLMSKIISPAVANVILDSKPLIMDDGNSWTYTPPSWIMPTIYDLSTSQAIFPQRNPNLITNCRFLREALKDILNI
jgi:Ethanolamine utilization protein EutJ (predicted chaperonin)